MHCHAVSAERAGNMSSSQGNLAERLTCGSATGSPLSHADEPPSLESDAGDHRPIAGGLFALKHSGWHTDDGHGEPRPCGFSRGTNISLLSVLLCVLQRLRTGSTWRACGAGVTAPATALASLGLGMDGRYLVRSRQSPQWWHSSGGREENMLGSPYQLTSQLEVAI